MDIFETRKQKWVNETKKEITTESESAIKPNKVSQINIGITKKQNQTLIQAVLYNMHPIKESNGRRKSSTLIKRKQEVL